MLEPFTGWTETASGVAVNATGPKISGNGTARLSSSGSMSQTITPMTSWQLDLDFATNVPSSQAAAGAAGEADNNNALRAVNFQLFEGTATNNDLINLRVVKIVGDANLSVQLFTGVNTTINWVTVPEFKNKILSSANINTAFNLNHMTMTGENDGTPSFNLTISNSGGTFTANNLALIQKQDATSVMENLGVVRIVRTSTDYLVDNVTLVVPTMIPEPASLAGMLVLGVAMVRRRRAA